MTKIAVLGAGSWGTTFAKVMADAAVLGGHAPTIALWARRPEVAAEITESHTNTTYLGETRLPEMITATSDLAEAVRDAEIVVLAVPAQSLRSQLQVVRENLHESAVLVSLIKGLERGTDLRMSEVIGAELAVAPERIAVVSGPNLAMEIAQEQPTASVVASTSEETAERVAALCNNAYFRPYTNTDVIGVEIAGIVKNVIALAVGICDGQKLGDNSKASVITRGLAETTRLATELGGRLETFSGLAGLGDLVATCASPLSRNRSAGRLLGEGLTADEATAQLSQTAEGMKSGSAVVELARQHDVEMPICEAVVAVLDGKLPVDRLSSLLLARDLKAEGR
ncbi:NAD(P)-dependent glycerol-3-phosphate dehydrogenase [Nesterenkonia sp. LB17]|uniref:NAD(P)H-dependent glycerol-3-phosphate dehydrogenase n=1 Tax=unclassified Nesterenkonia TaxID=2629769 RepID=UPI001F4CB47F|nr:MULTISPECIES: NAD(P)H-dependent glycerol-3-phosphate dehydrogenase [unclassified Nesterenkonia]MCH8561635.1 NAD(P)-dependent glycerol-3-phosphate dehydrogenase [Nesterenkonia sp. YGD6]MCH8564850.1 NAD(P)-dependent glycerol-3-phosphate dehydrogenase [Nesterenkonia sp. LB17]MCH8570466.1 NAD(P)-dependent glycerol-3-phosphate dehydrogenase [Nesterenkonia sp. AY15]